jgi:alpha-D-glucose phosphate-specific phosphoglucomutase
MSHSPIRFGTDGWRAVISHEFTFANVCCVAQAIADFVVEETSGIPSVVVGFDTRFLSDRYALAVAEVLADNGVQVILSRSDCPTPALSHAVRRLGAAAGVMITASHNPPRYNGLKVKASYGGPASAEAMQKIEACLLNSTSQTPVSDPQVPESAFDFPHSSFVTPMNLMPLYLDHLRSLVDLEAIGRTGLRAAVDPMYGSGRGYLRSILAAAGCDVLEIRGELNPGFGGIYPEPIERNLAALVATVRDNRRDVGLATDGDADRIGAVDAQGGFVSPQVIFALALRHLVEGRGLQGAVVKTVSTTAMLDVLADRYGLPLYETPVGFNHICDLMLANDVLIGGEESGGITIRGHIPEGDGILMGLLLLEIMATYDQPLHVIISELMDDIGPFHYGRHDLETRPFSKPELVERLTAEAPSRVCGLGVEEIKDSDGVKYLLEESNWLLIRPSGTEPVLRIYAEARSQEMLGRLLEAGAELAGVEE